MSPAFSIPFVPLFAFVIALLSLAVVNAYIVDGVQRFVTETFTAPVLLTTQRGPIQPGLLFLAPELGGNIDGPMIMTSNGELVWRKDQIIEAVNMNTQLLNGLPALTYWSGVRHPALEVGYGGVHIFNNAYERILHICGAKLDVNPLFSHHNTSCQLDYHESRITARGSILVTTRSVVRANLSEFGGNENGFVLDSLFYELDIPSENVLFRWSAYEHRHDHDLLRMSKLPLTRPGHPKLGSTAATAWDFFNMNSVYSATTSEGLPDGYIISSGYLWSVMKIDTKGDIDWLLQGENGGDFTFLDAARFSFQHDAITSNQSDNTIDLHLFDSANSGTIESSGPKKPSSGLNLRLDLAAMQVALLRRLRPHQPVYSEHGGNYQPIPYSEHVFVDFGFPAKVYEFDEFGTGVWETSIAGQRTTLYRVYKKAWVGRPSADPKAVASHNGTHVNVWMSWNGATNVYVWEIRARKTYGGRLKKVAEVNKSGFETHAAFTYNAREIQVAGRIDSQILGLSPIIQVRGYQNKLGPSPTVPGGAGPTEGPSAGPSSGRGGPSSEGNMNRSKAVFDAGQSAILALSVILAVAMGMMLY